MDGAEMEQPLHPLPLDPPEYSSIAIQSSDSFPSTSCHPVQQYGSPTAPDVFYKGPYFGQTVVTVPPSVQVTTAAAAPLANPLPDYLGYSIFTLLCCCLPLSSAALVYSITTRDANEFGHQPIASRNSRMARILNHASVATGLVCYLFLIGYIVIFVLIVAR